MSDKKERIDHILTQDVKDNKDSAKLDSLLYRDKEKESENSESQEDNPQNTSMLSFMWGNGKRSKKKSPVVKTKAPRPKNLLKKKEGKTTIRDGKDAVEISKDGISLKLSESAEGKLKLKISTGKRKDISKKRLAKIAMNAIIKELKKEE